MPAPIQRPALGGRNAPSAPPAVTAAKAKPVESSAIAVLAAAPILTPRRPKEAPAANPSALRASAVTKTNSMDPTPPVCTARETRA